MVNCRVIRIFKKNITVNILENGLVANLSSEDIFDKSYDVDLTSKF